ncbi:MAG: flagellar biosynthesis protein FlhF, partial [Chitinivibrionales bacterium]|nr:flagellar biosynthesis protein FlhF [Chitinivibrionales bacterium]
MRIKKYVGATMQEVLLKIKEELGENAMILKTRKLPKKLFSIGSQDQIEVTAAIDDDAVAPLPATPLRMSEGAGVYRRPPAALPEGTESGDPFFPPTQVASRIVKKGAPPAAAVPAPRSGDALRLVELKEDIRELKDMLKSILKTGETAAAGGFVGGWAVLYKRLADAEVRPEIAAALIAAMQDGKSVPDEQINKKFIEVFAGHFPVSGPFALKDDGPLVVALVGPTGAGKTTTLAKLAAHYSITKEKAVSIITADTYRIAAIEQIRTFADIVKIGLQVVFSPEEVPQALSACENDDLVLIDTAGRSVRNRQHM